MPQYLRHLNEAVNTTNSRYVLEKDEYDGGNNEGLDPWIFIDVGILVGLIFCGMFIIKYSVDIIFAVEACCHGERRCCPHLPTRHVRDGARSRPRNTQEDVNTDRRNERNNPTSTSHPPSITNTRDKIDFSGMTIRELREFLDKNFYTEEFSARFCSICLDEYHAGEEISKSLDPECKHIYHKTCIINWLESHDNCPICRRTYIVPT